MLTLLIGLLGVIVGFVFGAAVMLIAIMGD